MIRLYRCLELARARGDRLAIAVLEARIAAAWRASARGRWT